jgi:hypothetical protein
VIKQTVYTLNLNVMADGVVRQQQTQEGEGKGKRGKKKERR